MDGFMSTPNELKHLEAEILELEEAIHANARAAKRAARTSLGIGMAIIVVIIGFLAMNFAHLRSAMTQEKFARSLSKEISELSPTALREIHQLGQDLLPVFASELKKQVEAAWPEVAIKLDLELRDLGGNLLADTHHILSESEGRVLASVESSMFECYPQLNDPVHRQDLERRIHGICEVATTRSLEVFDDLFSRDIARMQESLARFDLTDTHETPDDLHKKFIHLWLQLLDQEVMEL